MSGNVIWEVPESDCESAIRLFEDGSAESRRRSTGEWEPIDPEQWPGNVAFLGEFARLHRAEKVLRNGLTQTLDWLYSFSVPPTSTIEEKEQAIAKIEKAIASTSPRPIDKPEVTPDE